MNNKMPLVGVQPPDSRAGVDAHRGHQIAEPDVTAAPRKMTASFHLDVDDAARTVCPQCGHSSQSPGLALNVTIGAVMEGTKVLLVRPGASLRALVDDLRTVLIRDALARANGVQSRAAEMLGLKYTTFHALARRLGLVQKRDRRSAGGGTPAAPIDMVSVDERSVRSVVPQSAGLLPPQRGSNRD